MIVVQWTNSSLEFLSKLDRKDSERIVKKIDEIKESPLRYIKGLVNKDFGKIRIGDYRLFVDYSRNSETLIIRSIKHRKNAYKNE